MVLALQKDALSEVLSFVVKMEKNGKIYLNAQHLFEHPERADA